MNRGELDALYELFDPGYVSHYTDRDMTLEQNKQLGPTFYTSFPDISITIQDMVAEGDKVAVLVNCRATHQGEYMGITPTGRKIDIPVAYIIKILGGRWVEFWNVTDIRLMQQLGVIPKY